MDLNSVSVSQKWAKHEEISLFSNTMKLGFFKVPGILDHIKKEEGGEERET